MQEKNTFCIMNKINEILWRVDVLVSNIKNEMVNFSIDKEWIL